MPNISDLENWRRKLIRDFKGKKVFDVSTDNNFLLNISGKDFKNKVYELPLTGVERFGKFIAFSFGDKRHLVFKISPEGKFDNTKSEAVNDAKIIITFENLSKITFFDDSNKSKGEFVNVRLQNSKFITPIGEDIGRFSLRELREVFRYTKRKSLTIKEFLTDQVEISGLNSVFVDEILFHSKIRPDSIVDSISENQLSILYKKLFEIIDNSVKLSISKSTYQIQEPNWFKTYKRHQKPCLVCGKKLSARKIGGNKTIYCSRCQKLYN